MRGKREGQSGKRLPKTGGEPEEGTVELLYTFAAVSDIGYPILLNFIFLLPLFSLGSNHSIIGNVQRKPKYIYDPLNDCDIALWVTLRRSGAPICGSPYIRLRFHNPICIIECENRDGLSCALREMCGITRRICS